MTQIAFLLLAHKNPRAVVEQVRVLTGCGDCVAVHYDAKASWSDWLILVEGLAGLPRVHLVTDRLRGGWGQWSLVAATLRLAQSAYDAFPDASHFYLISGDCKPIKPAAALHAYLEEAEQDFIESFDFFRSDWIKTGLKAERLIYRHPFNERSQKRLFYRSLGLQRLLGAARALPKGLVMRIGSQWWCLRRSTIAALLQFCGTRRTVVRFFETTWIPDETFFQTLVWHLVPEAEIDCRTLTRLMFSDYGMPVTFHADQADMLMAQDGFFVRKVAIGADGLVRLLNARFLAPSGPPEQSDRHPDMVQSYQWLVRRGRDGKRTPPPPWNRLAPGITVIICKKWHVAQHVARQSAKATGRAALGSVFDEQSAQDVDLGGYGRRLADRRADPRGYLSRVAEVLGTRHVMVPVDPCQLEVLTELRQAGAVLLRLDCAPDPDFISAHSCRIGLGDTLAPAVGAELQAELRALDALGPAAATVVQPDDTPQVAARRLARALDITDALANELGAELELTGG